MKTAEEWAAGELAACNNDQTTIACIKAIQQDAYQQGIRDATNLSLEEIRQQQIERLTI